LIFDDNYDKTASPVKGDSQIRYRMKPINRIQIKEERFATPDNKKLMIRARFKKAVIKLLTKLQAYHLYEKIKRNKQCVIPLSKIMKDYRPGHHHHHHKMGHSIIEDSDEDDGEEECYSADGSGSCDSSNDLSAEEMFGGKKSNESPTSIVSKTQNFDKINKS